VSSVSSTDLGVDGLDLETLDTQMVERERLMLRQATFALSSLGHLRHTDVDE
jgi:hypothetical protein